VSRFKPDISLLSKHSYSTHTELVVAEIHGMAVNIQVEHSWQPCLGVCHHEEVGQGTKPVIWVSVVKYVVPSSPVAHLWLWHKRHHLLGHLTPA